MHEYAVPESEILAGWMNFSTGEVRNRRCSSLRHMLLDNEDRDAMNRHDPIYQYGGGRQAIMVVNDLTGDVVTIYTLPMDNDWTACAIAL